MDIEFDPNVPVSPTPPTTPTGGIQGQGGELQQISPDTLEEIQGLFEQIRGNLELPEGRISIVELAKLITDMVQKLRALLYGSEFNNYDLLSSLHLENSTNANFLSGLYQKTYENFDNLSGAAVVGDPQQDFADLTAEYDTYNATMESVHSDDVSSITALNDLYQTYNNLSQTDIDAMGGEAAALAWFNQQITIYNNYVTARPDVQALIDDIIAQTIAYNDNVAILNANIANLNIIREASGLPPYNFLNLTTVPNPNPLHITLNQQSSFSSPLLPVVTRNSVDIPNNNEKGTINGSSAVSPGEIPQIDFTEIKSFIYDPYVTPILGTINNVNNIIEIAKIAIEEDSLLGNLVGLNIVFPGRVFGNINPNYLKSVLSASGGAGFLSLIFGPHSNKVEILLSSAMLSAIAKNLNLPISSRAFAKLIYSLVDILLKSSLLSSNRAALTLAPLLGQLAGSSSRVIDLAISLGFVTTIINLVNSDVSRSLTNGFINRQAFEVRTNMRFQLHQVVLAEKLLGAAINSGNPEFIRFALTLAIKENLTLTSITKLFNTLGLQSIGGLAEFTKDAAATLNITFLTVALAQLGRSIGLPNIVPQALGQLSNMSIADILTALSAGSQIIDYLDNPVNIAFLKQTLTDTVVYRLGLNSHEAVNLINTAINNVISKGSISNFSHLRAMLLEEFKKAGFNPFQANLLANETVALIRGDIGIRFLNAAFGINFDKNFIATSIVNNIKGSDIGPFTTLNANKIVELINKAMETGGFQTQREFRDELVKQFRAAGFSANEAIFLANSVAAFALDGTTIPLNGTTNIDAITGALTSKVAAEFGVSETKAKELVNEALKNALMSAPFSSSKVFNIVLKEEFVKAASARGYTSADAVFDGAYTSLDEGGKIQNLSSLIEQISASIQGLLRADVGGQLAKEIQNQILTALFGGTTVDEIKNEETKNPFSLINQIDDLIKELLKTKEEEDLINMIKKLKELLNSISTPNAAIGWLFQSLMDNPTTFISNLAMGSQMKRSVDIPI